MAEGVVRYESEHYVICVVCKADTVTVVTNEQDKQFCRCQRCAAMFWLR